jgi:hypothetical protein
MVADELRRQADIFLDIVELQSKIGRDPGERAPRPPREDRGAEHRERGGDRGGDRGHTPQFLQRPAAPQRAGAADDFDDEE